MVGCGHSGPFVRGWCPLHYKRWQRTGTAEAKLPSDFTEAEWFWLAVDQSGGPDACWPWTRYLAANGYGRCRHGWAHRYALELTLGRPLAPGMEVAHACDNPICCNPRHLRESDRVGNMRDAVARHRMAAGERNVHAKLTADDVRRIRASHRSADWLAGEFGVSERQIRRILSGERWKDAA